jgi:polyferredoxin
MYGDGRIIPISRQRGRHSPLLRRPRRSWQGTAWLRRLSQLGFVGFILFVVVRHRIVGEGGPIVTPSAEAFCPFGGVETLYRFITSGGKTVPHTHLSNVVILLAVLATALVARGGFCGWICPFGTLQEWLRSLGRLILRERASVRQGRSYWGVRLPAGLTAALGRVDRVLVYARYGVLIWIIWATAQAGYMVFRDYDPYAALLSLGEELAIGGAIILGLTAVLSLVVARPWCRYLCPLGATISIASKLSPVAIARTSTSCTACNLCTVSCPLNINVSTAERITDARCIGCHVCLNGCPQHGKGALTWRLDWPWKDWYRDGAHVVAIARQAWQRRVRSDGDRAASAA